MTLIKCQECKKEISNNAKKCPHCGFPIENKSGILKFLRMIIIIPIGVFIFVFAILFIKALIWPTDISESKYFAIQSGKERLESSLKDPSSVEYGDVWVGRLRSKDDDKGILVACGYFNARNGFGGMSGKNRFIAGSGGILLTDENPGGGVMDLMWKQACVNDRVN